MQKSYSTGPSGPSFNLSEVCRTSEFADGHVFALAYPSRNLKNMNSSGSDLAVKMILMLDRVEDSKDCCWGAAKDKEQY